MENDCYACLVASPDRCPSHQPKDEQLTLWPELEHAVTPGSVKHRGDCPACQAAFDKGAAWTSLPWSETYWAS